MVRSDLQTKLLAALSLFIGKNVIRKTRKRLKRVKFEREMEKEMKMGE